MSMPPNSSQVEASAKRIRTLILDVDGVLTDGLVHYFANGSEMKSFNVRDGLGIQLMRAAGCKVAIISGRESDAVTLRARELGIEQVFQGVDDKVSAFETILQSLDCPEQHTAYIGDDLPDLPLLKRCGLSFAVADAAPEVRTTAKVVLRAGGGQGAVREACELILKAKGSWNIY